MTQILMCRDKMNINTILLPLPLFFIKVWTLLSAWHNRGGALLLPPPPSHSRALKSLKFQIGHPLFQRKVGVDPCFFLSLFFRLEFLYEVSIVGNVSWQNYLQVGLMKNFMYMICLKTFSIWRGSVELKCIWWSGRNIIPLDKQQGYISETYTYMYTNTVIQPS